MIYAGQDIFSNFDSKTNSLDLIIDIYRNELSDLVVYNREDLESLFKTIGIKFNSKSSDEVLLNKIISEQSNEKLLRGIAFIISSENKTNADLKDKKAFEAALYKVLQSVKSAASEIEADKILKERFAKTTLDMIELKIDKNGGSAKRKVREKDNTFIKILVIAGLVAGAYYLYKWMQKLPSQNDMPYGNGGAINTGSPVGSQPTPSPDAMTVSGAPIQGVNANDSKYFVSPNVLHPEHNPLMQGQVQPTVVAPNQAIAAPSPSINQTPMPKL